MRIVNGNVPQARRLADVGAVLSRAARVRLAWMDYYSHGQNVALTCRHFGISHLAFGILDRALNRKASSQDLQGVVRRWRPHTRT